jgi:hypothetical protein
MVLAFVAACQQGNAMYRALFEESFLGTFFLQKPNNFLSTFAVGRRARWLEAWSAGNRHSLAEPRSKSVLSFAWTRGKSWHSGTAAPFSSPLQLASHDHARLDPNGGRSVRPGWWLATHADTSTPRQAGTCRSAAGTRGPRRLTCPLPPPSLFGSSLSVPTTTRPPPRRLRPSPSLLSPRGFLARACLPRSPSPLSLSISSPASSTEAACDDRLSTGGGARRPVRPQRAGEPADTLW